MIFGGRVRDLKSVLIDEKLPEEWESRVRSRAGLTSAKLNLRVLPMESRTRKEYYTKQKLQHLKECSSALNVLY